MFDSVERPFIRDILSDPESAAPRAAYADWLEEGNDVRTAAVRLGIALKERERRMFDELSDRDVERLRRELRNLNLDYSAKARQQLPQIDGVTWRKFEGGVIEQIRVDEPRSFERHAAEILDVQPIHQLEFSGDEDQFRLLLASPELARLGALYLGRSYGGPAAAVALADSPQIANLRRLDLGFTSIGDEGAIHLARGEHLGCRELALERNELGDAAVGAICGADHFQQLEQLDLGWNEIGPIGLRALAASGLKLRHLNLHSNEKLTAEGLGELVQSGSLAEVEWLNLAYCELPAAAGEAVFSGACPKLSRVNLIGNESNQATLDALAECELEDLRELRLELKGNNWRASASSSAAAWTRHLEVLRVRDCGGAGFIAQDLAGASLGRLREFDWHCVGDARSQPLDEAVARLVGNASLNRLHRLSLQAPLTTAALEPLCQLTPLTQLTLPDNLAEHARRLEEALPDCEIEFVSKD